MAVEDKSGGTYKDPAINRDMPIIIFEVSNGYIVIPEKGQHSNMMFSDEQTLVFESFRGLTEWLSDHFTHRSNEIKLD